METFSALLALCAGNPPATGEFPSQRPLTRRFGVFCGLRLNKRLSKQWWCCWFETPTLPLWRHCNITNLIWVSKLIMKHNSHQVSRFLSRGILVYLVQINFVSLNAVIVLHLCFHRCHLHLIKRRWRLVMLLVTVKEKTSFYHNMHNNALDTWLC